MSEENIEVGAEEVKVEGVEEVSAPAEDPQDAMACESCQ